MQVHMLQFVKDDTLIPNLLKCEVGIVLYLEQHVAGVVLHSAASEVHRRAPIHKHVGMREYLI